MDLNGSVVHVCQRNESHCIQVGIRNERSMAKPDPKCPKCRHPKGSYSEYDRHCTYQIDDLSVCMCHCGWDVKPMKKQSKRRKVNNKR